MDLLAHLHPKLVHFPVALFTAAWIFDGLSLLLKKESMYKAAVYVYVMAALSLIPAALSGLWEGNRLHLHHPVFYLHRNIAFILFIQSWISLITYFVLRRRISVYARLFFSLMCLLSAAVVAVVGFYGGQMVYDYGIGISS